MPSGLKARGHSYKVIDMKMSKLFSRTLRDIPSEAETVSHQLLLRAGFIRQLSTGIFSYLPLARQSLTKIENILRQEMNAIGGQEITMPVVHPADVWQATGRWYQIGSEMGRFKDRNERDMVLSMTHEEVIANLAHSEIHSYRQLPQLLYHIQTKWRDDPRPRAGLIRAREFTMKDSYSLDADQVGLDQQYTAHYHAYHKIFHRCGLPVKTVLSDTGMMGGKYAHEFMYLSPSGEDTIIYCDHCGYSANRQIAKKKKTPQIEDQIKSIEKVATPQCKTIQDLADFLSVPTSKTAKAVFMVATSLRGTVRSEHFVFALVRGDMDVNETKLAAAIQAVELRPATEDEIRNVGAVPGYASPVGLQNVLVIVDDLIPHSSNLVSGANEEGYHLLNVNYGRDFQANFIADIVVANEGDECSECGYPLKAARGVEVGNIFKLGTWISEATDSNYLDKDGKPQPVYMGSYGIGTGRLLACIAEEHHDDHGLIWPISVSPFQVHIVELPSKPSANEIDVSGLAEGVYQKLSEQDIDCLFDDREDSPGIKFNDADLIGNPLRLTISERSIKNGGIEFKRRDQNEKQIVPFENIIPFIEEEIRKLELQLEFNSETKKP
jgi:prolyl-tRNA synthetase